MADQLPVLLENVVFNRVVVIANSFYDPASQDSSSEIEAGKSSSLGVSPVADSPNLYAVQHSFRLNAGGKSGVPYHIELDSLAVFRFTEDMPQQDMERRAVLMGHNVLYAAAREMILSITGRQQNGLFLIGLSVLLPSSEAPPVAEPDGRPKV